MKKSFEFFSLDEDLKEKLRKGPEYQVGQYCFPPKFTVLLECILTGLKLDSKRNQNIFAFEEYGFPMIADAGTTPNEFLKVIMGEERG